MLITIQILRKDDGATGIEKPAQRPDDEVSPSHAFLFTVGSAKYISIVETAIGDAAAHHADGISQSVVDANDIRQEECQPEIHHRGDGCRQFGLAECH